MAANFNLPTVETTYTNFPTQIIENIDAALQQLSVGSNSNVPTGAIKWHSGQNRWKKYNGSSYENLTDTYNLAAAVNVTQLNLGDDEKIRLGNSNDIQLFHRSSDGVSILQESGGGYLSLQSNGSRIEMYDTANGRAMAEFNTGGACSLKHNATTRIATTNSGATVTGDLTTSGSALIGEQISLDGSTGGSRKIKIGQRRTAKAYSFIDLIGDSTYTTYGARFIRSNTGANAPTSIQHRGTGGLNLTAFDAAPISLLTSGTSRLYIESGGDVGIGLTNPSNKLHIYSGNSNALAVQSSVNGANILLVDNDTESKLRTVDGRLHIGADETSAVNGSEIRFYVDSQHKFTIGSDGRMAPVGAGVVGFKVPDNAPIANENTVHGAFIAGDGNDLMIFHDGSNSCINDSGTGTLQLQRAGNTMLSLTSAGVNIEDPDGGCVLRVIGFENSDARVELIADEGDNNADTWRLTSQASSNNFLLQNNNVTKWSLETDGDVVQTGQLYIQNTFPMIELSDTNSENDFQITNASGRFRVRDIDAAVDVFNITSSGSVLINNTNENLANNDADDLIVGVNSGAHGITIVSSTSDTGNLFFSDGTGTNAKIRGCIVYNHGNNGFQFMTDGYNERLKIDNIGDIFVSKRLLLANNSASYPAYSFNNSNTTGFYRHSANQIGVSTAGTGRARFTANAFGPLVNDEYDLGGSSLRFDNIFATNGTINTSDKNFKNTIAASDLGLEFINKLNPVSYKFNGKKRTHYGLIAQEIETVLSAISKPATDFAGFCKDEVDEDGKSITPIYALRYTEFIAPIIKAIQELSAKVAALESA